MEKSLCLLAAVIFLGGFFDAALMDDASTESYSIFNNTTAATAESVTAEPHDHSRDPPTPTTAESKLSATTVRVKQLDSKNTRRDREEDSKEEDRDDSQGGDKTQLGRTKKKEVFDEAVRIQGDFKLIKPDYLSQ